MTSFNLSLSQFSLAHKSYIWALVIFIVCFAWILFLTQGLPIGDPDDWDHVLVAQDISWEKLLTKFSVPWSASHLWTGQIDRINEMTNRRLFLTIVLKSISSISGLHSFPFYVFSKALFFSGTAALLFLFLTMITTSVLFALAGTLFFVFIPAHYPHVLWITDPITMVHCLMLIGLWNYLKVVKNMDRNGPKAEFFMSLIFMFLAGYTAIKAKEPGLTFPMIAGAYAFFSVPRWKSQKTKLFFIFFAISAIALQIIPFGALGQPKEAFFPKFHGSHIYRMLFQNYNSGYDDEPVSAFFSLEHLWPVSIARTFGFFLLWTLMIFAFLYGIGRINLKQEKFAPYFAHPLIVICFFWLIFEIIFMGLFQTDPRYFSGTMIPLSILTTRLIYCVSKMYFKFWKWGLWTLPLFSLVWSTFDMNFNHVIYLRRLIGQRTNRFLNLSQTIYADRFPHLPQNLRSLALFYCAAYVPKDGSPRLREVSYFIDMNYDAWNKLETGTKEEFNEFAKQGFRYYAGFEKDKFGTDPRLRTLAIIDGINKTSLLERALYRMRKPPLPMYLIKYDLNQR